MGGDHGALHAARHMFERYTEKRHERSNRESL
jgi:hypothetical protein